MTSEDCVNPNSVNTSSPFIEDSLALTRYIHRSFCPSNLCLTAVEKVVGNNLGGRLGYEVESFMIRENKSIKLSHYYK